MDIFNANKKEDANVKSKAVANKSSKVSVDTPGEKQETVNKKKKEEDNKEAGKLMKDENKENIDAGF